MIEILDIMHSLLEFYIFRHLIIIILFLVIIDSIWKKRDFKFSYSVMRYAILTMWVLNLILLVFRFEENFIFENRATGPYWWGYQFMFFGALVFPILLLHNKLGRNKWILLTVGFLSTFGLTFELFIILITSLHQNYLHSLTVPLYITHLFLRPLIMTSFLVGIDLLLHKFRTNEMRQVNEDILDGN